MKRIHCHRSILTVLLVLGVVLSAGFQAHAQAPQQSTTGPVPPPGVAPKVPDYSKANVTIPGVPGYSWRHGCGPTAVGMVIGYYDAQGRDDLIPGDASTQTAAVSQAIASGGSSGSPASPEAHWEDYARPQDSYPTMVTDDCITAARTPHVDDCIADFMLTSRSTSTNYYGWSWSSHIKPAFENYVATKYTPTNGLIGTCNQYSWSSLTWALVTNEIDNGRPMVFLVDTDASGGTDHFVTIVGYRDDAGNGQEYGCLDTWAPASTVRWCGFQQMDSGVSWGVWGGWTFQLADPPSGSLPLSTLHWMLLAALMGAAGSGALVWRAKRRHARQTAS
ncbi:MAG: hypothetical protein GY851_05740 [bacterium]|nr:hypothetical protein [bacterium]